MEPSLEDLARERHARCNPGFPWRLIGLIALCLAIGGLGSAATMPEIKGWYASLVKPTFNPPNWIFGPVWSTLYVLMACSANAAWTDRQARRPMDQQVRIGFFSWTEPMPSPVTHPQGAPHEQA